MKELVLEKLLYDLFNVAPIATSKDFRTLKVDKRMKYDTLNNETKKTVDATVNKHRNPVMDVFKDSFSYEDIIVLNKLIAKFENFRGELND